MVQSLNWVPSATLPPASCVFINLKVGFPQKHSAKCVLLFLHTVQACAPLYVSTIQILPIDGVNHAHATPTGRCVVLSGDLSNMTSDILQITNSELILLCKLFKSKLL